MSYSDDKRSLKTNMSHENTIRLYAGAILFVLTLLVGTVPIYLLEFLTKRSKKIHQSTSGTNEAHNGNVQWKERIVSFLTQVGGGVLFYTAYIHMLPEIREHYETYLNGTDGDGDSNEAKMAIRRYRMQYIGRDAPAAGDGVMDTVFSDLPVVDLLACAGLFGIFLLEEVMHFLLGGSHHHHHHHGSHSNAHPESSPVPLPPPPPASSTGKRRFSLRQCLDKPKYDQQIDEIDITSSHTNIHDERRNASGQGLGAENQRTTKTNTDLASSLTTPSTSKRSCSSSSSGTGCGSGGVRLLNVTPFTETDPISTTGRSLPLQRYNTCSSPCSDHHRHSHQDVENNDNNGTILETVEHSTSSSRRSVWPHIIDNFLLILAFSCHSIFDGISIGVQQTENDIWPMLIAILSHKLIIAFILAFQIYEKCTEKMFDHNNQIMVQRPIPHAKFILWIFSGLFALMSPLGILLVMVMDDSQTPDETNLKIIILAAISAGTILYIVFFEIVDKSSSRNYISGLAQWIALVIGFGAMHFISHAFHEAD